MPIIINSKPSSAVPAAVGSSSTGFSCRKPTLQQLRVVLEAALWEHQGQRLGGMWSGLLLLVVLLSAADPTVRLAFLAGVPGGVLLRLLGEVAAGEEGTAREGSTPPSTPCTFQQWQAKDTGPGGACVLAAALARGEGVLRPIPTRQAVLQVLLWCFFEVVPQQEQQQEDDSKNSSSGRDGGADGVQQAQQLLLAAQLGLLWAPGAGEGRVACCNSARSCNGLSHAGCEWCASQYRGKSGCLHCVHFTMTLWLFDHCVRGHLISTLQTCPLRAEH
jgi:hypothetical protein